MLKKHLNRDKNNSSKNFKPGLLVILIIVLAILSGCISQQPEVPEGNPEIDLATPAGDYNATPAGYYNESKGMFTVINGSTPEVGEHLIDIINKKASQQSTFSVNDDLNLVVFRGAFHRAEASITIDKVEKQGNVFTVYATYTDWRGDAQVETLPTEIIPIGKLAAGNYEARLRVTKVWDEYIEKGGGVKIEKKVVESEKEISVFNFKVNPPEDNKVVLEINPVIDISPLEGFHDMSEGMFTVINGSIPEVKENLKNIVINKATQQYTFYSDDTLNLVVFRGVFNSGGYGININKVEREGNTLTIYATYTDPGKELFVTGEFTHPVAIVPIGKLAEGEYKADLKVTKVLNTIEGEKIIETEKESGIFNFEIKNRN